ncbi:MAG: DUF2282 domain-containing protein [Xanthobacteraceae bacterium]
MSIFKITLTSLALAGTFAGTMAALPDRASAGVGSRGKCSAMALKVMNYCAVDAAAMCTAPSRLSHQGKTWVLVPTGPACTNAASL